MRLHYNIPLNYQTFSCKKVGELVFKFIAIGSQIISIIEERFQYKNQSKIWVMQVIMNLLL